MPYRVFSVPASAPEEGLQALNQFLGSHRVVDVDKRFHADEASVAWHFCVNYATKDTSSENLDSKSKFGGIDYKEVLTPEDFAVYSKLRDVRKTISQEKSLQLFAILTNKQLAELAQRRVKTLAEFRDVNGIGEKKAAAFGQQFLDAIQSASAVGTEPAHQHGRETTLFAEES
ncbi:MAG: HRDC domain-containing protein [Planctomycetota bacterium]|nr:HRDC domain-containing protein [Planctomycetota bacterium]